MCSINMFIELKKYLYTIKYFRTPRIDKNNYQYIFSYILQITIEEELVAEINVKRRQ